MMKVMVYLTKNGTLGTATFKMKWSTNGILPSGTTNQLGTYVMATTTANAIFERRFVNYFGNLYNPVVGTTSLLVDNALSTTAGVSFAFDRTVTNYIHFSMTLSNAGDAGGFYGATIKL